MKLSGSIILQDFITEPNDICCRTNKQSHDWNEDCIKHSIPFQTFDDDGNLYHAGLLVDDEHAENQDRVLAYAMNDAGCTYLKVYRNGKWIQEIG